jgi:hypothetical protein
MAEPTSSGAAAGAAGIAGWNTIGGLAGVVAGSAGLAAIVVMLMTPARSPREWAVGLISTVVSSIAGGAWVIEWLGMHRWLDGGVLGLMSIGGLMFFCGLPGWALVRAAFTWLERRKHKDLGELGRDAAADVRNIAGGGQ